MKMSGFIGTVSATHKTINIFTLPGGKRVGRSAFIGGILNGKRTAETEPHRVIISVQISMRLMNKSFLSMMCL
jgi:hypothetical protein